MSDTIWADWNGQRLPLDEVRVPATDRAFLFGDAVYEVVAVRDGRGWLEDEHFTRLRRSLGELEIPADVDAVRSRYRSLVDDRKPAFGSLYLQVTRGSGPRRHAYPADPVPNTLMYLVEWDADPMAEKRRGGVAAVTAPDRRWGRCDIKSVNLLGNCMVATVADRAGAYEALMVDADGRVTEGSRTSVLFVVGGRVRTMPLSDRLLPSVTRQYVLSLCAAAGVPVDEQGLPAADLDGIDEAILVGTGTEVTPLVRIDGQPVGDGTPGPTTLRLQSLYAQRQREWLHAASGA